MSVQRTPKGAALVKNTFKVKPLSPKNRQHSLKQGEKGSIITQASHSLQHIYKFLFFLAPPLFLWRKRGPHLKQGKKNKFQHLLQQPAPVGIGMLRGQGQQQNSL